MIEYDKLVKQLKRHEGVNLRPYLCPAGYLTIGYGHNLDANPVPGIGPENSITDDQANRLLGSDISVIEDELKVMCPTYNNMRESPLIRNRVRAAALLNIAFNIGVPRLLKFRKMLKALDDGHYSKAATEALDSRWSVQVGKRSHELAVQIATGEWLD